MVATADLDRIPPIHDGGIPFSHNSAMLAEKYGTPLFVFVETAIQENIAGVLRAFRGLSPAVKLFYASKANSNLAVLQIVNRAGAGLEVNSGGELLKALHVDCPPEQIVFNGVAKSDDELALALKHGIYSINVDSLGELERLCRLAAASNSRPHVSLRICADVEPGGSALQTGSAATKFGMDNLELEEALSLAVKGPVNLRGLHLHLGAQLTDLDEYRRGISDLFLRAADLRRRAINLETINIGGGFPVSFAKPLDLSPCNNSWSLEAQRKFSSVPSLDSFGKVIRQEFRNAFGEHGGPQLLIEPGTCITATAGLLLTRVVTIKERQDSARWIIIDGGANTLPDLVGYRWFYHIHAAHTAGGLLTPTRVAGPLCDGGDVFSDPEDGDRAPDTRLLPSGLAVNDLLWVLDVGAYSLEQMSQYNGRYRPGAILIRADQAIQQIRTPDTFADLIAKDIPLTDSCVEHANDGAWPSRLG